MKTEEFSVKLPPLGPSIGIPAPPFDKLEKLFLREVLKPHIGPAGGLDLARSTQLQAFKLEPSSGGWPLAHIHIGDGMAVLLTQEMFVTALHFAAKNSQEIEKKIPQVPGNS
ncbi:MAG: hypothetical protein HQM03_15175 [Magnetococcales bacterium]|nr:hypothetical protein [Magnetococcales bacterium]